MKKTIGFFALITLLFSGAFAQVTTLESRKFDADDFLDHSLSLGHKGIVMYGWEDNTNLAIKQLDTNLENKNTWKITTEKRTTLHGAIYAEDLGVIVVMMKQSRTEYVMHTIEVDSKKKKATTLSVPKGTWLSNMVLNKDVIWFVASTKKTKFLFKCPIKSPRLTPVNLQFGQEKELISTLGVIDNKELFVGFDYGPKKHREFDIAILNSDGKIKIKSLLGSLESTDRQLFIDGNVTALGEDDYAITGLYNKKRRGIGNGVYFARFSDGKTRYMSKFDYSDFEHFYDYLSDKRREKIEGKIAKKKDKGKEVTINSMSIMHRAILTENGLVFIGEYYYPTYRTETYYVNGKMQTRTVFDGYQYTHGMAIGISNDGTKLFDHHIPMLVPYKPMVAQRFLRVVEDSTGIKILHTSGRAVFSSVIMNGDIGNNEWAVITDIPENQKEKWSASVGIYWYENHFFILEQQKIKEKGKILAKKKIENYAIKISVE